MNGWHWSLKATCSTCGSSADLGGPHELVRRQIDGWLADHDRHEFDLGLRVLRPEADDVEGSLPDFMRVVRPRPDDHVDAGRLERAGR